MPDHSSPARAPLTVSTTMRAGEAHVLAAGELDLATAHALTEAVEAVRERATSVVIDLAGVRFMDSTGLRVLLTLSAVLGDGLAILPSPEADRVIDVCGVREHLPIVDGPAGGRRARDPA